MRIYLGLLFPPCVVGQAYFKPWWHTPNLYAADGKTLCAASRPLREGIQCPNFCAEVKGEDLTSKNPMERCVTEFEEEACNTGKTLFPNGLCCSCPEGSELDVDNGELYCTAADGSRTEEWICGEGDGVSVAPTDPCSCLNDGERVYKSCRPAEVSIDQYYKTLDNLQEWTMERCAEDRGINDTKTRVDLDGEGKQFEVFNFPLLYQVPNQNDFDYGFVQCPRAPFEAYRYDTPAWWVYWGILIFFAAIIPVHAVYKYLTERRLSEEGVNIRKMISHGSMKSEGTEVSKGSRRPVDEAVFSNQYNNVQCGYRRDWLGWFTYYYIVCFACFQFAFLIIQILDVYGLFVFTFCPSSVNDACREVKNSGGEFYNWRTGVTCASACLFGAAHSTGTHYEWPYWRKPGGGANYQIIFMGFWLFCVAFFCILRILKPYMRTYFRMKCALADASIVQVEMLAPPPVRVESDSEGIPEKIARWGSGVYTRIFGPPMIVTPCKVTKNDEGVPTFDYRSQRWMYDNSEPYFTPASLPVPETHAKILAMSGGLTQTEAESRMNYVGQNFIAVYVPSLFRAFFNEGFDYFYFYQVFGLAIAYHFNYFAMALANTVVVVIGLCMKVFTKRNSQLAVKKLAEIEVQCKILRDGEWVSKSARQIVPGDVIELTPGMVACDIAVVAGRCVVDESALTGEPAPVPKGHVENSERRFHGKSYDPKFTVYSGTTIQSAVAGDDGKALGLVLATGSNAIRGKLLSALLYPSTIIFKFNEHWAVAFIILLFIACCYMAGSFFWYRGDQVAFYYGLSVMLMVISPLIPATFVVAQARAARHLRKKQIFCVEPARTVVAGKVKYACFDKTGTITNAGMTFEGVCPLINNHLGSCISDHFPESISTVLGTCNELDFVDGVEGKGPDFVDGGMLVGNEVDKRMFLGAGYKFSNAAEMIVGHIHGSVKKEYKIHRRYGFERATMTMSAVVEDLKTGKWKVVCKGQGEGVAKFCSKATLPDDFLDRCAELSSEGIYALGIACKDYDGPVGDASQYNRNAAETNLTMLGVLCFKNEVKHDSAMVMAELKGGSVRILMVTGDALETGVRIGKECGLSTARRILRSRMVFEKDADRKILIWEDAETKKPFTDSLASIKDELHSGETELAVGGDAFEHLNQRLVDVDEMVSDIPPNYFAANPDEAEEMLPNSMMDDLLMFTRIYARMKPEQKVEVVAMHMKYGVTSMCGDGANDAAALQRAHAGMALATSGGSGEVSAIVAHFATPSESLTQFSELLKVGRGGLATMMHGYKVLLAYGQQNAITQMISQYIGISRCEFYWIHMDAVLLLMLSWCIMESKPSKVLKPRRPTSKLLGTEILVSLGTHILINGIFLISLFALLFQQGWFRCKEIDVANIDGGKWWLKGDNYEAMILGLYCVFNVIISPLVFNFGFDYRVKFVKNWWVILYFVIWFPYFSVILFKVNGLSCFYRSNCGDVSLMEKWSDMGLLNYNGPYQTAPPGCSCTDQIGFPEVGSPEWESYTCENEYLACDEPQFNQFFHHDILPKSFSWTVYGFILANLVATLLFEGVVMVGPVRRYLQRKKASKKRKGYLIIGEPMEQGKTQSPTTELIEPSAGSASESDSV